ncbi:hypothetical protein [Azospirillum sp. Sh1]|uniref:hypothetical protein n=1 Tax=Azospirillum sp. Sh1 TaxID=2607285 RepID=UPI0011F03F8B|nr:hypothetical protein [Azospirillum sp. Sh1]KAA0573490.1 hypothetical protein FZ029_21175 [Azospirillum sp. Sh1]
MNINFARRPALPATAGFGIASVVSGPYGHRFRFEPENGSGTGLAGSGATDDASAKSEENQDKANESASKTDGQQQSTLSEQEAKLLKDLMKHKNRAKEAEDSAAQAKKEKEELEKRVAELLGVEGIDELQGRLEAIRQDEETRLRAAGEFDKLKDRLVSEHTKEIQKLQGTLNQQVGDLKKQLEQANGQIRKLLVSNAFAGSAFINGELVITPTHAERLYGDHFKVEVDGEGNPVMRAYNAKGEPLIDSAGNPLPFDAALAEIVNADPGKTSLFRPKAKPGAGSGALGTGGEATQKPQARGVARIAQGLASMNT